MEKQLKDIYEAGNLLFTQENVLNYKPGGFHPVCLGDTFKNGRYKVHHKLGFGGYGTVWLANDSDTMRWVSIKIMTADRTSNSHELRHLQSLMNHSHGDLGSKYIVQLLDDFVHQGPNGSHQCLVFELLGPSIDAVLEEYQEDERWTDNEDDDEEKVKLEPDVILKWSEQILQATKFLHDAGYVHGDISRRNILFTSKRLWHMTEADIMEIVGNPEIEQLSRLDGNPLNSSLPSHLVKAAEWDDWIDEDEEDLRLIDLGECFLQGEEPERLAQPGGLQAPETLLTNSFDYRVDLWRVGITLFTFAARQYPFDWFGGVAGLVASMTGFVEDLPQEWQEKWDDLNREKSMTLDVVNETSPSRLEKAFRERVHDEALKPMQPVIEGLMRFRPSDRISVEQALDMIRAAIEDA